MPEPPSTYLGKVKVGSLQSFVAVEAELTARGITNWVQRPQPNYTKLTDLRALLPRDDDGYLIDGQASDGAQGVDLETDSEGHMGEERGWFESLQAYFASDEQDE